MKIAVVHNLPPGGQKRALYEQVKRLSQRHQLDLFTLSETNESFLSLHPFVQKHYKVPYNLPLHFPKNIFSIYFTLPRAYKLLADQINCGNYNVAYVNPCYLTQAPYILQYLKIPSVYYCPEPKREFYEEIPRVSNWITYNLTLPFRLPIKKMDRDNVKKADTILTNSYYSKTRIEKTYNLKAHINYLGVDWRVFKPKSIKKQNLVLTVGEVSLHKGHDFLIRAVSLIPQKIRPLFIIIGPFGSEANYLLRLAQSFNVNLRILNNITDIELVDWYNKAKVFLYAAHREPFGLSVLEAISCGTYVLGVKEGGVAEIIKERKLGELVIRSEELFSKKILDLLQKNDDDKNKYFRYEFTKMNWDWDKSVSLLEKYFHEKHLHSHLKL